MGESIEEIMKTLAARAVVLAAKSFEVALDFTPESVGWLEAILERYHQERKERTPGDGQVRDMALLWGAYLGETMLKCSAAECGYAWRVSEGQPVLQKGGRWEMSPVVKVEKRLRNGPEDSVMSFFHVGIKIAEGKILA